MASGEYDYKRYLSGLSLEERVRRRNEMIAEGYPPHPKPKDNLSPYISQLYAMSKSKEPP